MTSFVEAVLSSAGQMESEEIHAKLGTLTKTIESLKLEVHQAVSEKYIQFFPSLMGAEDLNSRVVDTLNEIKTLTQKVETEVKVRLTLSTGEFQSIARQLEEARAVLEVLEKLVQLQDGLEKLDAFTAAAKYSKAAATLGTIQELLSQPIHHSQKQIKIVQALKTEYIVQKQNLIYQLGNVWKENVQWDVVKEDSGVRKVELKVAARADGQDVLKEAIQAMDMLQVLPSKVKDFGEKFLKHLVEPILTHSQVKLSSRADGVKDCLLLGFSPKKKGPAVYMEAFKCLTKVFHFLSSHLSLPCDESGPSTNLTFLQVLGQSFAEQVVDAVVKECLCHAIPSKSQQLESFHEVITATQIFQEQLLKIGFLPNLNTALLDYVQNVTILFANKKCQEILEEARQMMKQEFHNTVEVSDDKPLGDLKPLPTFPKLGAVKKAQKSEIAGDTQLSANTFRMPACWISESVQKLMGLAYDTLHEATESSPQCATQLFYAVRNIFELFLSVVPTHHKQNLETLPQAAALHHSNCMYISHHLMTLGHQFQPKLPDVHATFLDLIPKVRQSGTNIFLAQIEQQRKQLMVMLEGAAGFAEMAKEKNSQDGKQAVRQVLHQLKHLCNVWREVLPPIVLRRSIGLLVNAVVTHVVDCVTALEDISAQDGRQLQTLLEMLGEGLVLLFQGDSQSRDPPKLELQRHVPCWAKFLEVQFVLGASLQEIDNRWADGKGPMAVELSPTETKQMIRALFQNTERRAAVLAKIH